MGSLGDRDDAVDGDVGHGSEATEWVVGFRELTDADLPLLHRWLNDPEVVRWWEGDDVSWDAVVRDYGSGSDERTEHWLVLVDGREVGWIQTYALADYADDDDDDERAWVAAVWALGVDRAAAGIDYLIGEASDRGRGLGPAMIRAFVRDIVFGRHPGWTQALADPHVDNRPSWRALELAGFRAVGITQAPTAPGACS